jgi:hypothetical protein
MVGEAQEIMNQTHEQPIRATYIHTLARQGLIKSIGLDKRTKLFLREDVERYKVKQRPRQSQPAPC